MNQPKPHSADVLNDIRDYWYSPDFIALMAKRWNLGNVKSMLDVGCGMGHWGQLLAPHLADDATIDGIDPEIEWIKEANERSKIKIKNQSRYQVGTAEHIPFPDNHFDMVTCQTVLVHVKDVALALKEMLRVLKPNGLIAVAEPNNLVQRVIFNNITFDDPIDTILDAIRFELICERGRSALGRGNANRGDIIPYFFHEAGLNDIQIYQSDLADYFIPPYSTPREKLALAGLSDDSNDDLTSLRDELKPFYLAGNGVPEQFQKYWEIVLNYQSKILAGYRNKTLCAPGGTMMYLVSAIK